MDPNVKGGYYAYHTDNFSRAGNHKKESNRSVTNEKHGNGVEECL